MAGSDLSGVSDEELLRSLQAPAAPAQGKAAPSGPSDAELLKAIGQEPGAGDTIMDAAKSFGSGVVKGATALADMPGDIVSGGVRAAEYLTGADIPDWLERGVMAMTPGAASRAVTGESATEGMTRDLPSVMGYKPQTTAGRYAGTIGEFVPGAAATALTGGTSMLPTILRGAVAPGVASEFAGQVVEGSSNPYMEPAARLAGAILGGVAVNKAENFVRGMISPSGGADPTRIAAAADLRARGVPVTAGQATGSRSVLNAEADTPMGQLIAGATPDSQQAKAFTSASMRFLGSADDLATPQAMAAAEQRITSQLRSSVAGVDVPPSMPLSLKAADAAKFYDDMTPDAQRIPLIRGILDRINQSMNTGTPIAGDQLASWRSSLGKLLYHDSEGIRGTSFMLREAIDEALENSMRAMGQPERIKAWQEARDQYRNFLAVQDALKVTKAAGVEGVITPKDLMAALAKQDKAGIVTGRRGEIGEFAGNALTMLNPLPKTVRHGLVDSVVRRAGPLATAAGAGFGALQGAQFLGAGPLMTGLATTAAVGRPLYEFGKDALRGTAMNPMVQRYLGNQLVNSTSGVSGLAAGAVGGASAVPSISDRMGRKSGGRVGIDHDHLADQLVGAAERAKKGISKETEALLDVHDDHIAHALEVANRSI